MNSPSTQYSGLNQRYDVLRKRESLVNRVFSTAFSPASAFAFGTLGYYSLAIMVGSGGEESKGFSIYIRLFLFALVIIAYIRPAPRPFSRLGQIMLPATIFLLIYTLRLFENIFISDVVVASGAAVVMGMFLVGGIIPSYMISARFRGIQDRDFVVVTITLFACMVAGLIINRDLLLESSATRMGLEKINPISLGHLGFSFLIFFVLSFKRSLWIKALAVVGIPLMAVVIVYARSRGPYLAGAGALLLYILLLKGTRRIWLMSGFGLAAIVGGYIIDPDLFAIVTTQLSRTDVVSDMSNQLRVVSFTGAWNQFLENSLVGRYVVEMQTGYYPHNIYLESLMSVGIIGTVPFVIHLILTFRSVAGIIRHKGATIWATFAAVSFVREAIGSAVSGSIWGNTGFWITSFVSIVVWYGDYSTASRRMPMRNGVLRRRNSSQL